MMAAEHTLLKAYALPSRAGRSSPLLTIQTSRSLAMLRWSFESHEKRATTSATYGIQGDLSYLKLRRKFRASKAAPTRLSGVDRDTRACSSCSQWPHPLRQAVVGQATV